MSAYMVDPEHINELVKWAKGSQQGNIDFAYNLFHRKPIDTDVSSMVDILVIGNINSMVARYGHEPKEYDHIIDECKKTIKRSTDGVSVSSIADCGLCSLSPDDIYSMACCLDYQSCEVDNWIETDAYWLIQVIKDTAARKMFSENTIRHYQR